MDLEKAHNSMKTAIIKWNATAKLALERAIDFDDFEHCEMHEITGILHQINEHLAKDGALKANFPRETIANVLSHARYAVDAALYKSFFTDMQKFAIAGMEVLTAIEATEGPEDTTSRNAQLHQQLPIKPWKQCYKFFARAQREAKEYGDTISTVSVDLSTLPELDLESALNPDEEEDFIEVIKQEKVKNTKRKRVRSGAKKHTIKINASAVGLENPDNATESGKGDNEAYGFDGDIIFPSTVADCTYICTPARSAPFHNGRRLKKSEVPNHKPEEIVWASVEPESFVVSQSLDVKGVSLMASEGYIPRDTMLSLLKDLQDEDLARRYKEYFPEVVVLSLAEVKAKHPQTHDRLINAARINLAWGLAVQELNKAKFDKKVPFVDKWMRRLHDVPADLPGHIAANTFYAMIKKAIRRNESLNRVFYGFLSGNLANWKRGESRATMLGRTTKSLEFYWGNHSTKYTQEFLKTADAQCEVRPVKLTNMMRRLRTLATKKAQEGFSYASAAAAAAPSAPAKASSLYQRAKAKLDEAQNALSAISWRDQAVLTYYKGLDTAKRAKGRSWEAISSFFSKPEEFDDSDLYNLRGCVTPSLFGAWTFVRIIASYPFIKVRDDLGEMDQWKDENEAFSWWGLPFKTAYRPWLSLTIATAAVPVNLMKKAATGTFNKLQGAFVSGLSWLSRTWHRAADDESDEE